MTPQRFLVAASAVSAVAAPAVAWVVWDNPAARRAVARLRVGVDGLVTSAVFLLVAARASAADSAARDERDDADGLAPRWVA